MHLFIAFLALFLGALTQSLIPVWSGLGGVKPPILSAIVLYYALRCEPWDLWKIVLLAVLFYDGLAGGYVHIALIAFPAIAYIAQRLRFEVFPEQIITQFVFGSLGAALVMLISIGMLAVRGERPMQPVLNILRLGGALLSGFITMPVVSFCLQRAEVRLPQRREIRWK